MATHITSRRHRTADIFAQYRIERLSDAQLVRLNEMSYRCRQENCGGYVEFVLCIHRRASRTRGAIDCRMYVCSHHAHRLAQEYGLEAPC